MGTASFPVASTIPYFQVVPSLLPTFAMPSSVKASAVPNCGATTTLPEASSKPHLPSCLKGRSCALKTWDVNKKRRIQFIVFILNTDLFFLIFIHAKTCKPLQLLFNFFAALVNVNFFFIL